MQSSLALALLVSLTAIQLFGLASAVLARLSQGSRRQVVCQRVFLGCLGIVGLGTIVSVALSSGWWLASGTTLSLMVLTATWDCGRSRRRAAW